VKKHTYKIRVIDADATVTARKVLDAFQLAYAPDDEIDSLELYDFVTKVLNATRAVQLG
jgi:hypothetical protein